MTRSSDGPISFTVDGETLPAQLGQTIAGAMLAADLKITRWTAGQRAPRGVYCGIGLCQECLVTVDGERAVRSCVTPVRDGLVVEIWEACKP